MQRRDEMFANLRTPNKDGKIVKVAKSINKKARHVINAKGLTITPGFIDMHTHAEQGKFFPGHRAPLNYLKQGVTTVIVGQCGSSAWPTFEKMPDQVKRWTGSGIGLNAALLVGHGFVRRTVMGNEKKINQAVRELKLAKKIEANSPSRT